MHWIRDKDSLVADVLVDEREESALITTLASKPGENLPCDVFIDAQRCDETVQPVADKLSMRVKYQRYRLVDGRLVTSRESTAALTYGSAADGIVADFRTYGTLIIKGGRREVEYHREAGGVTWVMPKGYLVEDARFLDAGKLVVAVNKPGGTRERSGKELEGRILVFKVGKEDAEVSTVIRAPQREYQSMISSDMAVRYFYGQCLTGDERSCRRAKGRLEYGRLNKRPEKVRLGYSSQRRRLLVYGYGDLWMYNVKEDGLELVRRIANVFYSTRDWYILDGRLEMGRDGNYAVLFGKSGLVRVIDVGTGNVNDILERQRIGHVEQSGIGSGVSLSASGGKALWIGYRSWLHEVNASGRVVNRFHLSNSGFVKNKSMEEAGVRGDSWDIEHVIDIEKYLVVQAAGRALVCDKAADLKVLGLVGYDRGRTLRRETFHWGHNVKWYGSFRRR